MNALRTSLALAILTAAPIARAQSDEAQGEPADPTTPLPSLPAPAEPAPAVPAPVRPPPPPAFLPSEPEPAISRATTGKHTPLSVDTNRVTVGLLAAIFASFPGSIGDPAPTVTMGKPLWLGERYGAFQQVVDVELMGGYGVETRHVHLGLAPRYGGEITLGRVFGFGYRFGLTGLLQAGPQTVAGAGFVGSVDYVFRFWDDDRQRLRITTFMRLAGYFEKDPGNDLGAGASALGLGLAYDTPL